jgi:hypothetical protein
MKVVDADGQMVNTARSLGVTFGDGRQETRSQKP